MLKRLLSLIMVSFLIAGIMFSGTSTVMATGNTYYVATTGNDTSGNGSFNNPWKTIQKAASVMVAGDTCEIRGGVYRETVTPANSGNGPSANQRNHYYTNME